MSKSRAADPAMHESGEAIAARTDRRRKIIIGAVFTVGLVSGMLTGIQVARNGFEETWPPAMSLGIAAMYLIALAAGSVALSKVTDEIERTRNYKAAAFAGVAYLVVYPVWFLLWKGGFVTEPVHWVLFAGFWLALAGATLFYRFR